MHEITSELAGLAEHGEDITTADIEKLINDATLDEASDADVARVSARLAAGGWPLADGPLETVTYKGKTVSVRSGSHPPERLQKVLDRLALLAS